MEILKQLQNLNIVRSDPGIMSGALVFTGTRVPLKTFFDYLTGEEGLTEFIEDYPHLRVAVMQVLEVLAKAMLIQNPGIDVYSVR